jgi:hypothetical protein
MNVIFNVIYEDARCASEIKITDVSNLLLLLLLLLLQFTVPEERGYRMPQSMSEYPVSGPGIIPWPSEYDAVTPRPDMDFISLSL